MEVTSREFQKEIGKHIDIASSGEPVIITRHGRPAVALVPAEYVEKWSFDAPQWRSILNAMSAQWPVKKTDYELVTELMLHWQINQSGNSRGAKLDKIYDLILWVARKLGYEEQ